MPRWVQEARTAVCTIVSRNYMHFARTLMNSLRETQPGWEQYVLLVDRLDGAFHPSDLPFGLVELDQLPLPEPRKFFFRYTILEANTAVKPWLLDWLFTERGMDRVVYLDPDIYTYRPLDEVTRALDGGAWMVLTPHITGELDDGKTPSELDILRAGCFNLGFIALARHRHLRPFLHWWQERLEFDCRADVSSGIFVDQKWLDLVPGRYDGIAILRHPGYNVAYWNLPHRRVEHHGDSFFINGQPLAFFHFSGLNPAAPEAFSKYQDRFELGDLGPVQKLVAGYCEEVLDNGHDVYAKLGYAFGRFSYGGKIPDTIRRYYRESGLVQANAGEDPFSYRFPELNEPWRSCKRPLLSLLMRQIWEARPELHVLFPILDGADGHPFIEYFLTRLAREMDLPRHFVRPVRQNWLKGRELQQYRLKYDPRVQALLEPTRRLLPQSARHWFKRRLHHALRRVASLIRKPSPAVEPAQAAAPVFGLNVVGYVHSEHGVGESARLCAQAATAADMPFGLFDFNLNNSSRTQDTTWTHKLACQNRHWVNLFHVNADQMQAARLALGPAFCEGRYNIGYWHWELPEFPSKWQKVFDLVDEVWVPSHFIEDAVRMKSPRPVVRIPHAIQFQADPRATRSGFGLPERTFLFLAMYDTHSVAERKNPEAVIRAFQMAFPNPDAVGLVIKVNNPASSHRDREALKAAIGGFPGIHVIDRILTRQEVYDLENLCDCFVSLHRSEGFGLGLAESMYLGKPVIGTNWSGNRDFMTVRNSCPVQYRLVRLDEDHGPYPRGQFWADPDCDHAAWFMKKLVEDHGFSSRVAARGRQTIRTRFSPEVIGGMYRARLIELARQLGGPLPHSKTEPQPVTLRVA